MSAQADGSLPSAVVVKPWRDPSVERCGFPVGSAYVETAWLPTLGPSATFALRRLGLLVSAQPEGVAVDLRDLAADLGISQGTGRQSVMSRTLRRLESFGMARWRCGMFEVRPVVPPLPVHRAARLSPGAASVHRQMLALRQTESDCALRRSGGLSR